MSTPRYGRAAGSPTARDGHGPASCRADQVLHRSRPCRARDERARDGQVAPAAGPSPCGPWARERTASTSPAERLSRAVSQEPTWRPTPLRGEAFSATAWSAGPHYPRACAPPRSARACVGAAAPTSPLSMMRDDVSLAVVIMPDLAEAASLGGWLDVRPRLRERNCRRIRRSGCARRDGG